MKTMKKLLFLLLILIPAPLHAGVLEDCQTLYEDTAHDENEDGAQSIVQLTPYNPASGTAAVKRISGVSTASNTSGTTPTYDVEIQTCRTSSGSCRAWMNTFDQCTTGSCYTDGFQNIDADAAEVNWFQYFRAKTTLAGTSPVYNVKVELCWEKGE